MGRPSGYREKRELMDRTRLHRTLLRMAHEIVERHPDPARIVLVGVRTRGVPLAHRLARCVSDVVGREPAVGALDITLYRDDLTTIGAQPVVKGTEIPCSIDGRAVVLVDDVLFTGRTVRAALDELIDFGRPARIALAVLVDRGHRELPIHGDHVGTTVTTAREEIVQVKLQEEDGEDRVLLLEKETVATGPKEAAGAKTLPTNARRARKPRVVARGTEKKGQLRRRSRPSRNRRGGR